MMIKVFKEDRILLNDFLKETENNEEILLKKRSPVAKEFFPEKRFQRLQLFLKEDWTSFLMM